MIVNHGLDKSGKRPENMFKMSFFDIYSDSMIKSKRWNRYQIRDFDNLTNRIFSPKSAFPCKNRIL